MSDKPEASPLNVVHVDARGENIGAMLRVMADDMEAERVPGATYQAVVLVTEKRPDGSQSIKMLDCGIRSSFEYIGILHAGIDEITRRARYG